jgi:AcrR family transcriptional regulator
VEIGLVVAAKARNIQPERRSPASSRGAFGDHPGIKDRFYRTSRDRRSEIIRAAFSCLQEFGYAKITARKVAERSDSSLGHISYHFKSMNEVLIETYRYASGILFEATQQDLDKSFVDPIDKLRAFISTGFSRPFLKPDYLRVRIDLWSASLADSGIAAVELELYETYRQTLMRCLQEVATERGCDHGPVGMLADTIMATLDGLWLDWERRHDEHAIRNGLDGCIVLVSSVLVRADQPRAHRRPPSLNGSWRFLGEVRKPGHDLTRIKGASPGLGRG